MRDEQSVVTMLDNIPRAVDDVIRNNWSAAGETLSVSTSPKPS